MIERNRDIEEGVEGKRDEERGKGREREREREGRKREGDGGRESKTNNETVRD